MHMHVAKKDARPVDMCIAGVPARQVLVRLGAADVEADCQLLRGVPSVHSREHVSSLSGAAVSLNLPP